MCPRQWSRSSPMLGNTGQFIPRPPPPPIVVSPKRSILTKVTYDSFPSLEVAVWLRTQVSLRPTHRLLPPPSESGPGYRVSPFRILRVGQVGILTRALIPGRAAFGGQVLPWSCHGLRETRWYIKRSYLRYCPPPPHQPPQPQRPPKSYHGQNSGRDHQ